MQYLAKHLEAAEAHEGINQTFAVIAAAGGPTMAALQAMPISQSADLRAEFQDAVMDHGDIMPSGDDGMMTWTVSLCSPVCESDVLTIREPLGRDLQTPGRTAYQHNRNLLLNVVSIPERPGRLKPSDIDGMALGDYQNLVQHLARIGGTDYQGF